MTHFVEAESLQCVSNGETLADARLVQHEGVKEGQHDQLHLNILQ